MTHPIGILPANNENTVETLLNRMNQNNSIETSERNGYTLYYTITRGGNGLAAITYIEGTTYAFIEIVNTQSKDLEAMLETAFSILTSVEIIPEEAE